MPRVKKSESNDLVDQVSPELAYTTIFYMQRGLGKTTLLASDPNLKLKSVVYIQESAASKLAKAVVASINVRVVVPEHVVIKTYVLEF